MDGVFTSELDNCTPHTRKSRMTAMTLKDPPRIGKAGTRVKNDVLSQKSDETPIKAIQAPTQQIKSSMLPKQISSAVGSPLQYRTRTKQFDQNDKAV